MLSPARGYIKIALPKGRLFWGTTSLITEARLGLEDYKNLTRLYRLQSSQLPYLLVKVFHEKDIPIQVAVGNYDLGICGLDWVEELLIKYPASGLMKVMELKYGSGNLYAAASQYEGLSGLDQLLKRRNNWRIVSEYPNLAEAFALGLRLRRFRVFPVWGNAEVYPPENADLIVVWKREEAELEADGLRPLKKLLSTRAVLVANRQNWKMKNMSDILSRFSSAVGKISEPLLSAEVKKTSSIPLPTKENSIYLALPDGHQRRPVEELLNKAGLQVTGYCGEIINPRPIFDLDWIKAKVIRPQDMPLQVANGNFDLAITGKDWLLDHLYQFPSSPVIEHVSFSSGEVKIVAAVSQDLPVNTTTKLRQLINSGKLSPLRVATEYVNIADKYLRDNHLSPYRIIPTWGASEAFLPEDADLLIENTQTGETLAKHNLKIVEILFSSTACLIGNKIVPDSAVKRDRINSLIDLFRQTAGGQ